MKQVVLQALSSAVTHVVCQGALRKCFNAASFFAGQNVGVKQVSEQT
jgi:hypothetical protein